MGLRSGLLNLGPPRRCVADLAAPIQLAPAAQQSKIKSAHQPPRSYRGQPVEAPQLEAEIAALHGSLRHPFRADMIRRRVTMKTQISASGGVGLGRGGRMSRQRKRDTVLRMLRGE